MHLVALLASFLLMAFTYTSPTMEIHYKDYNGNLPKRGSVYVCHGSGCEWKERYRFSREDFNYLKQLMKADSPQAERQKIGQAIAWIERRVCKTAGTCNDKAGASWATSKVRGQLECVDESMNTTSYLLTMQTWGMLKHHKVLTPIHRYSFSLFPHWAARLSGGWVVDSYFGANGTAPQIIETRRWVGG